MEKKINYIKEQIETLGYGLIQMSQVDKLNRRVDNLSQGIVQMSNQISAMEKYLMKQREKTIFKPEKLYYDEIQEIISQEYVQWNGKNCTRYILKFKRVDEVYTFFDVDSKTNIAVNELIVFKVTDENKISFINKITKKPEELV